MMSKIILMGDEPDISLSLRRLKRRVAGCYRRAIREV